MIEQIESARILDIIRNTVSSLREKLLRDIDAAAGKAAREGDEERAAEYRVRGTGYNQALADAQVNLRRAIETEGNPS